MKRLLICFALVLCFCLAACSLGNADDKNANNTPDTLAKDNSETVSPVDSNSLDTDVESETEPPVVIPPEPVVNKVSFLGAGDNIVYYGTVRDAQRSGSADGRKYNFKPIYSEVAEVIEKADVAFINQETLMCGDGYQFSYYPCFNGPQDMGYDLVELGFDVIGMANNHMLDKGSAGLEKTIAFYDTLPVTVTGGYKNIEDYKTVRVHEKNGIKIAFLSYTEMTNGLRTTYGYDAHIPYLNEANIEEEVAAAKAVSDIVIVSVHWGTEGAFSPNAYQKNYAQKFADSGVDVILGHHPHVVQPVEWIEGKDGNKTLCVYSLGNFMAEQEFSYNMVGGMISFDMVSVDGEKPTIENVVFIPTVFDWGAAFYDNRVYLLEEYTAQQAANHGIKSYGWTTSLKQLRGYITNTISDEFLSEAFLSAGN